MSVIMVIGEVFWPKLSTETLYHRLNMELDLQSLFGLLCAQLYSLFEIPQLPPLSSHLGSYTRALLVKIDNVSLSLCNPLH
jgi:hypothetical protein